MVDEESQLVAQGHKSSASNQDDIRYLLVPEGNNGFYRPRANSGVVLLAAGLDNLPPPPK